MPGPRDNGGHLMEMHEFWYDGCNCGSTRCINHMYTCGIRQRRAFVSMQHFGQSKVTSRSLQGQSFINSNNFFVYKPSYIVHFWIGAMYRNIDPMCGSSPESREVKWPSPSHTNNDNHFDILKMSCKPSGSYWNYSFFTFYFEIMKYLAWKGLVVVGVYIPIATTATNLILRIRCVTCSTDILQFY